MATWAVDMAGTIIVSEGGALRALGIPPGTLVGTNFFAIFGRGDGAANMHRAMAGEPVTATHVENGRTLESRFIPVRGPDGAVIHVVGITLDITARLESAATLDRQSAAVREQAATPAGTLRLTLPHVAARTAPVPTPAPKRFGNPALTIAGIRIEPMATTVAGLEPDTAANSWMSRFVT